MRPRFLACLRSTLQIPGTRRPIRSIIPAVNLNLWARSLSIVCKLDFLLDLRWDGSRLVSTWDSCKQLSSLLRDGMQARGRKKNGLDGDGFEKLEK